MQNLIEKQDEFKKSMEKAKAEYNILNQIDLNIKKNAKDNQLMQINDNPYTILDQEVIVNIFTLIVQVYTFYFIIVIYYNLH